MLIEFTRRPTTKTNTRTVECFGQKYVFKELIPGRWVAEVSDPKAAKALTDTGAYREFTDQLPASTLAAPPAAPVAPPPAAPPAPVAPVNPPAGTETEQNQAGNAPSSGSAEVEKKPEASATNATPAHPNAEPPAPVDPALDEAAKLILVGQPTQVRKAAKNAEKNVLARALEIEQAQAKPRPSVVALLQELAQG